MSNILHEKVFEFCESYRSSHPDFFYWLRERNTKNRFEDGIWFQGKEDYAFVGLYNRSGGTNMTRSVGLVFSMAGDKFSCTLENVFNEENNQKVLSFYEQLRQSIGGFSQVHKTKYSKLLSIDDGFEAAVEFLDSTKASLDELVLKNGLSDLLITGPDFEKKLEKINQYRSSSQSTNEFKYLIANITWNSNDWKEPSHDKSGHKWVSGGGQPHESWNFDFDNPRNPSGKIFGFVQVTNPPKVYGDNNLVIFYSNDKIVGFYGKCEFLSKPEIYNEDQSYNLIAEREYCIGLAAKIEDVKKKGYLEDKDRVGQIGFNYLKRKETIIKILDEAIELNPDQEEKLKSLKEWVNDSGPSTPSEKDWEDALIRNITIIGQREKVDWFFSSLNEIVSRFQLKNDDPRISFSTPRSQQKYLSATVGQRYIIALENKSTPNEISFELGLIGTRKDEGLFKNGRGFMKTGEYESHSADEIPPAYYYFDDKAIPFEEPVKQAWVKAVGTELDNVKSSSFRKHHNPLFFKAVVDPNYREYLMNKIFNSNKPMNDLALNQIFFGPPGTGKTYHTIHEAIRIADPDFYKDNESNHEALRGRFNELLITDWKNPQKGKISFCTFHQSFSYEDFIEGIKPIITDVEADERNESLKYTIEDGIFKRMADRARHYSSITAQQDKKNIHLSESEYAAAQFYKLSLGDSQKAEDQAIYDYCIENSCIAIGFMSTFDLKGYDEQRIYKLAEQEKLGRFEAQAMCYFSLYLKEGNYVIVSKGNLKVRAIGKVKGTYYYKEDAGITYKHFRKVEWIITGADIPVEEVYQKAFSQQSIYKLNSAWINKDYFVKPSVASSDFIAPNFVLIIDEINRGNISQIFGELITLIEKDKRSGNPEALQVTLPYSKEKFNVPANLYLIGTMNTADRSIEALDTALRRRFVFREMPAKPQLIAEAGKSKGSIDGIDLVKMLEIINHRIEKLLDKDHQIGHSYLLEALTFDDLVFAFSNQIIPLLEEYFYGSMGKIGLVLGENFVNVRNGDTKDTSFARFKAFEDDTISDLATRKIYHITDHSQWTIENFKSIYE